MTKEPNEKPAELPVEGQTDTELFFDCERNQYVLPQLDGSFTRLPYDSAKRLLIHHKFQAAKLPGAAQSQIDRMLAAAMSERSVDYVGALAGHDAGYYPNICGNRVLVPRGPQLPTPKEGDWTTLRTVLENMLTTEQEKQQLPYFYSWCKIAWESLRDRMIMPGQALVFVGSSACGKSLIQRVISVMVGGRVGKPWRYLSGATPFNADLIGTEHLMIEDEQAKLGMAERRNMGARIKEFTVCMEQSCHAKGRQAAMLTPWWRVTMSLNDEDENVTALPPMDDSVKDKFMILKCWRKPMPMPTGTPSERDVFTKQIFSEVPAFLHWLEQYQIPEELKHFRYGVKEYHHPEIAEVLKDSTDDQSLLDLIDQAIFATEREAFTGKASRLQSMLYADLGVRDQAKAMLHYRNATGSILGKLAKDYPERIKRAPGYTKHKKWIIQPPEKPVGIEAEEGDTR